MWGPSGLDKQLDDQQTQIDEIANNGGPAATKIGAGDVLPAAGLDGVSASCPQVTFSAVSLGVTKGSFKFPRDEDCAQWQTARDMFGFLLWVGLVAYAYVSMIRAQ